MERPGSAEGLSVVFKPPALEREDIMSNGAEAAAAIARAVKTSGVLMRLEPEEFLKVLNRMEAPLVVVSMGSFFSCYLLLGVGPSQVIDK